MQQIHATGEAFAAILGDGSVVTCGHADFGGDSSVVQDQLKNVQQIQGSHGAFVAILGDGSVVTWGSTEAGGDGSLVAFGAILSDGSVVTRGDENSGGNSDSVQDKLKNVQQIQASGEAFAAILGDGLSSHGEMQASVVTAVLCRTS